MKKILIFHIFIFIAIAGISQSLKSKLIGSWVKIKTETLDGKDTCGSYGLADDYLRISFAKNKFYLARAPWDRGDEIYYKIDHDTIETAMHHLNYALQETYYFVEKINDTDLILSTTINGKIILYILKNQLCFKPIPIDGLYDIDNDTIIFVRSHDPYFPLRYLNNSYSNERASEKYFISRPIYNNINLFKEYICHSLSFKEPIAIDKFSKPIKVSYIIDYKGKVSDIKLVESFIDYYDQQIINLIRRTNKKWIPTIIELPSDNVKMTFTFLLLNKSTE
jgi:hypothetical protein